MHPRTKKRWGQGHSETDKGLDTPKHIFSLGWAASEAPMSYHKGLLSMARFVLMRNKGPL